MLGYVWLTEYEDKIRIQNFYCQLSAPFSYQKPHKSPCNNLLGTTILLPLGTQSFLDLNLETASLLLLFISLLCLVWDMNLGSLHRFKVTLVQNHLCGLSLHFLPYGIKKSFLNTIQIKGTPPHRFLIYLYLNFIFCNFIQYPDVIICMRQWKRA